MYIIYICLYIVCVCVCVCVYIISRVAEYVARITRQNLGTRFSVLFVNPDQCNSIHKKHT